MTCVCMYVHIINVYPRFFCRGYYTRAYCVYIITYTYNARVCHCVCAVWKDGCRRRTIVTRSAVVRGEGVKEGCVCVEGVFGDAYSSPLHPRRLRAGEKEEIVNRITTRRLRRRRERHCPLSGTLPLGVLLTGTAPGRKEGGWRKMRSRSSGNREGVLFIFTHFRPRLIPRR